MLMTRMLSEIPGNAGFEAADPPDDQVDSDARRGSAAPRATIAWGSTSAFILAMIRAGRPASAFLTLAVDQRNQPIEPGSSGRSLAVFQPCP